MKKYNNIPWLPKKSFIEIVFQEDKSIPVTAVFCFVFSDDGSNIYVMENVDSGRGIDVPGGHIDPGETPVEAVKREVLEEIGVAISDVVFVGSQKIVKTVSEEKYPDLISTQNFYMAKIDSVVTDKLEKDSLGRVLLSVDEFCNILQEKHNCYYIDLYERALDLVASGH